MLPTSITCIYQFIGLIPPSKIPTFCTINNSGRRLPIWSNTNATLERSLIMFIKKVTIRAITYSQ